MRDASPTTTLREAGPFCAAFDAADAFDARLHRLARKLGRDFPGCHPALTVGTIPSFAAPSSASS